MGPTKKQTEDGKWLPWLVSAMGILAVLFAWDWISGSGSTDDTLAVTASRGQQLKSASAALSRSPLTHLSLDQLHETVARPLFEKLRRPVARPTAVSEVTLAPVKAAKAPNSLTLIGVLKGQGVTVALLKRGQTGQNVRAEEGDIIDGWTIKQIESQRVVLVQGESEVALQLLRSPN